MQSRAGGWPTGAGFYRRWKGGQHPVSETPDGEDTRSLLYSVVLFRHCCCNTLCLSVIFTSRRVIFTF